MSAVEIGKRTGLTRRRLSVSGVVQGVGFRPYVHQLARRWSLTGFVRNTPLGAVIEVEGPVEAIEAFAEALPRDGPPLMRVAAVESLEVPRAGDEAFVIGESERGAEAFAFVPPDICVCAECLADTRQTGNRRFEYPFTNCTNCGPRYSIIEDVPYDRAQTTMCAFGLCEACRREYEDPGDRRFHAQPNACPVCGPRLELVSAGRERSEAGEVQSAREILGEVAQLLLSGRIVAWKGLGGYQLACDARNGEVVRALRRRKHRQEKPFAVMVRDAAAAERLCRISSAELAVLEGPERPIVLLERRAETVLAVEVFCGIPSVGVMLPSTPMHELLFRILAEQEDEAVPLVMTSGNLSEEPIAIDDAEAMRSLRGVAEAFVLHNRPIHTRVDDSVVRVFEDAPMLLRRARGYAPEPVWLGRGEAEVLACGAQQKSTLCLTKAGFGLLSQHLGDLENYETLEFFEQTRERIQRLFHAQPRVIAHDLHPGYLSTQLALKRPADRRFSVQHHHAHIAACMAEHGLEGEVIGIAWDGTGLGTDGTIWGGEFLVADFAGFERVAHLRPVPLAGGDAAVREPWRMARSYLHDSFDNVVPRGIAFPASVAESSLRTMDAMLRQRIHVVETSSCGRFFDAVASIVGLRQTVCFEGQAAMLLEAMAADSAEAYDVAIVLPDVPEGIPAQVDTRTIVREIVADVEHGVSVRVIAARFHNTLIKVAVEVCRRVQSQRGLRRVCLSGGCFQNVRLLRGCVDRLRSEGFEVFFPQRVPANDGGISLGQAAIACELIRRGV